MTSPNEKETSEGEPSLQRLTRLRHLKLVTTGDSLSGKSCFIKRYCEKRFVERYLATIGLDYGVRDLSCLNSNSNSNANANSNSDPDSGAQETTRIHFFDLSGSPADCHVRIAFYTDTHALVLCFDPHQRSTFDHLTHWMKEAHQNMDEDTRQQLIRCVCANMTHEDKGQVSVDEEKEKGMLEGEERGLSSKRKRVVSEEEGKAFAKQHNALYFECSAKTGRNVDVCLQTIFQHVLKHTCCST